MYTLTNDYISYGSWPRKPCRCAMIKFNCTMSGQSRHIPLCTAGHLKSPDCIEMSCVFFVCSVCVNWSFIFQQLSPQMQLFLLCLFVPNVCDVSGKRFVPYVFVCHWEFFFNFPLGLLQSEGSINKNLHILIFIIICI